MAFCVVYFSVTTGVQKTTKERALVLDVVDGDTISVRTKSSATETIRLLGVDTPETKHPDKSPQCFGEKASNFTMNSLVGREVELEYDIERIDKYERILAYVYVGEIRFNDVLVENGYARILNIEPNSKYAKELLKLQLKARNSNVGLWGKCS